jgi:hypothetical protein
MLAVAVVHDDWWMARCRGCSGYYAGGYYADRRYAGGGSIVAVQSISPNGVLSNSPGRSAGLVTLAAMPRAITAVVKATVMVKSTSDPAPTHLRADFLPRT